MQIETAEREDFQDRLRQDQPVGDNNGGISTSEGSSNFGAVTSAYDPRTFQLGLKFVF